MEVLVRSRNRLRVLKLNKLLRWVKKIERQALELRPPRPKWRAIFWVLYPLEMMMHVAPGKRPLKREQWEAWRNNPEILMRRL